MSQMDISRVQMVRSAKGIDMLCVDNYLYHFIDRGYKRCRWVCNRLKNKREPCRARLATVIVNGDESVHRVVRVTNEHSHERCSQKEISKVVERKIQANLAEKPNTLKCKYANKFKKRASKNEDENLNEIKWGEDDGESDEWPADEGENDGLFSKPSTGQRHAGEQVIPVEDHSADGDGFFDFQGQKVHMLRTALGRQMICVEGYLYRLESKSITSTTHRWECIKQDPQCKVRILTARLPNGAHRLKDNQLVQHCHDSYTLFKLAKLLQKNNIKLLSENGTKEVPATAIRFTCAPDSQATTSRSIQSIPPKKRKIDSLNNSPSQEVNNAVVESKRKRTKAQPVTYNYSNDPLAAITTSTKKDLDKAKFTFLPSAKGHKVLCLDNYIYHLDTRCPRNGRGYWTCLLRRDKFYKCNARVTTEMTSKGPIVVRVSGKHLHSDHSADIKKRLCRSFVAKNAEAAGIDVKSVISEAGSELNKELREIIEKSKEAIERKIGKLKREDKGGEDDHEAEANEEPLNLDENSVSSLSSVPDSNDDLMNNTPVLPTKLDEMIAGNVMHDFTVAEKVLTSTENEKDAKNNSEETVLESLVQKRTVTAATEDEMEVEYLDLNTGNGLIVGDIEVVKSEDDNLQMSPPTAEQASLLDKVLNLDSEMNLNNVSTLCSAKGGQLLCVDGYIYHIKSTQNNRTYWMCIKHRDPELNCRSRVATVNINGEIRVFRTANHHTHPVYESDIKRRLYNEFRKENGNLKQPNELSFEAINTKYSKILGKDASLKNLENFESEIFNAIAMTMKLYAVSDGPPSLAVRMAFEALHIPYELIDVNFIAGEHMSKEYAKINPQKEIPVLDDDGFYLSESIAIMQYLCDKYAPSNRIYPKDPTKRAIVNHRLCFNMGFYYAAISAHSMAPIFFDYQRTEMSLKKVNNALDVFETYLRDGGTKYAATDYVTIADFALVTATMCLEAINFDLSTYPLIKKWYETFKQENSELWAIANGGMQEIARFEKNPPDLSHMNHPFHPTRKTKT